MQLVFASSNKNKIAEIQNMLPDGITVLSLEDIGCHEEIPETADTIEGNAVLKADYVSQKYGYDCFADDSGLEVDALGGAPGVYSARYAGEQKNAMDNMHKLLEALSEETNRSAQFKTVLALNLNGEKHLFSGILKGKITDEMRGTKGFGYDPIFQPEGYDRNLAEFSMEEKAAISHRGIAVKQLVSFLNDNSKP
ncbi:non-canonical purine NTP pyrophosphatase [Flavobacterium magnum]|uniref:dITP/XTP pyrophosphatase n=1 Tax=Flavobacterium magnum TaxID=2162713 RepID=A0A2S0RF12_9FLAO|nr:non-canonical purine NTP diphosphatase [Flavobacterium magnum]AWA30266.1 non-canonical purine NTP pyrophosphatase [Flavobacterium magnum]